MRKLVTLSNEQCSRLPKVEPLVVHSPLAARLRLTKAVARTSGERRCCDAACLGPSKWSNGKAS